MRRRWYSFGFADEVEQLKSGRQLLACAQAPDLAPLASGQLGVLPRFGKIPQDQMCLG